MQKNLYTERITLYIMEFMLCGFIGWTYETVLTSAVWGEFADRGLLSLPICPIYGVFAMVLLLLFGKRRGTLYVFAVSAAAVTVLELLSSYFLEIFFHLKLWSYEGWAFNFDGRVSLFSSLIFGGMGVLFVKLIHPAVGKCVRNIPVNVQITVCSILVLAVSADLSRCIA